MDPVYTAANVTPAYQLNWGLTIFWRERAIDDHTWFDQLKQVCEPDGVRLLKHRFTTRDASQFFLSTKPPIAPSEIIRSVKGRLQHLIGSQLPKAFRRNYAIHSIGAAKRTSVEDYVATQLGHHPMADPRVQQLLARYQRGYDVNLSAPTRSSHGEYWHNLHLVIVNDSRWMEIREPVLDKLAKMIERVAEKRTLRISRMALLADHLHLVVGCPVDRSREEVALTFMNNCAYSCGMKRVFRYGFYVGTIGEYDRGAVR